MRTNGYLQYEIITGDVSEDEFGRPIEATAEWSELIPCSIITNSDTSKGVYEDGNFRQASFTVIAEGRRSGFNRIKLTRDEEFLGEYTLINGEYLTLVNRTKIIV